MLSGSGAPPVCKTAVLLDIRLRPGAQPPQSPLGPLVAEAAIEGYQHHAVGPRHPFHGYLYRLLTSQGAGAPGGVRNYIVDGKMTGGFALVAYPASYRDTGVMTFIVNQDGQIYQKGPRSRYRPDSCRDGRHTIPIQRGSQRTKPLSPRLNSQKFKLKWNGI